MNISSVSSNNSYYLEKLNSSASSSSTAASAAPADGDNPLEKTLSSLQSSLNSGDTATAKSILTEILSHSPKTSATSSDSDSSSTSSTSSGDQLTSFLKSLQEALSSGDVSSAETLEASLKSYLAANPPPPPPTGTSTYSTNGNYQSTSPSASSLSTLA